MSEAFLHAASACEPRWPQSAACLVNLRQRQQAWVGIRGGPLSKTIINKHDCAWHASTVLFLGFESCRLRDLLWSPHSPLKPLLKVVLRSLATGPCRSRRSDGIARGALSVTARRPRDVPEPACDTMTSNHDINEANEALVYVLGPMKDFESSCTYW